MFAGLRRHPIRRAGSIGALFLAGVFAAGWLSPPAAAQAPAPRRVVSINLCADQLLLALAAPEQIASLSIYATDPALSFSAAAATTFRHSAASAESVLALDPDLVLAGRFTNLATQDMLRRLGYRVVEVDVVRTIDEAIAQVRAVAVLLGHPERGERLAELIDYARAQAVRPPPGIEPPSVIVYQRRGYVSGSADLTADLIATVGLVDKGAELAGSDGGFVPLEKIVASPPDYLIVSNAEPAAVDQGTALLEHPALLDLFPPERRIELPDRLTVCGGPALPEALRFLSSELRRKGL